MLPQLLALLPTLDHTAPAPATRMVEGPGSVVDRWLREPYALDGCWIDVVDMTGRCRDVDVTRSVARTIRATVAQAHPDALLGSHDTVRIRTVVGSAAMVEVALGLLMTYPGTPMVFVGDEVGATGTTGEHARVTMPCVVLPVGCAPEGGSETLHGPDLVLDAGGVHVPGDGPGVGVWRLR